MTSTEGAAPVVADCDREDRALSQREAQQANMFPGDARWGSGGGDREYLEVFALGRWHLTTTRRAVG